MRAEFTAFMDANPPTPKRAVLSPYFPHLVRIPAMIALALVVVSGTAYAAEHSLPNDPLYPVKTSVIEPVFIRGLAFGDRAQASANNTLVDRRLKEAVELIERDEMDPENATKIATAIDRHTEAVSGYVTKASQEGDLSAALDAGTELENTLEAHGDVLASIVDGEPSTAEIYALIDAVAEHANAVENAGEAVEEQVVNDPEETREYVDEAVKATEAKLVEARERADALSTSEELLIDATTLLTASESALAAGTTQLAEGNAAGALPLIRDALQSAGQAEILLESSQDIDDE